MDLITGVDHYLNSGLLPLYFMVVLILGLHALYKFGYRKHHFIIFLIFWEGLFIYLEKITGIPMGNFINIFILFYSLYLYGIKIYTIKFRFKSGIIIIFIIFTISFITTILLNNQPFLLNASYYSKKYFSSFVLFFGISYILRSNLTERITTEYLLHILKLQIIFSLLKLLLFGFGESLVGSVAFIGGATGNLLPVMGFLLIWSNKQSNLRRNDWFFIILLILIGIIGNKRSVIFIYPIVIIFVLFYVDQVKLDMRKFFLFIPLVFLLFYIGVKTNPSLNPERSRWGSFDISYSINYSMDYLFGSEAEQTSSSLGQGRGGGLSEFLNVEINKLSVLEKLFGFGITEFHSKSYLTFENEKFGINSKGSVGGALGNLIMFGIIGTISILILGYSYIRIIKNKRLLVVLLLVFLWEYFLLGNHLLTQPAISFLLFYIIHLNNNRFKTQIG